ncbi:MAG: Ig-like domain repeat protein [Acidobacteriaceae bacterium]|nr:Ig-like domain repeat protein [Acidobacteriaceae bacterium]
MSLGAVASTQGSTVADFVLSDQGSCTAGAVSSGSTCTAQLIFQPKYPGNRLGAVQLKSASGQLLGQGLVSGVGTGGLAVLKPGRIDTIAGSGDWIYRGDGMPATLAQLFLPMGLVEDASGNLYISDSNNNRVRRVDGSTALITTVAGTGNASYNGDGFAAVYASVSQPSGLAMDGAGDLFVVDSGNHCVRRIDASSGLISTVAGVCGVEGYTGDGSAATSAHLTNPESLALASDGSFYIADTGNNVVRRVAPDGTISTYAGTGVSGYSGDGGTAVKAQLAAPWGVAMALDGTLYIAELNNDTIRKVSASGTITTIAGLGSAAFSGDGGAASSAGLNAPSAIAVDPAGNLYIADSGNNRVREVNMAAGTINTIVGGTEESFAGDGGPSSNANLYGPYGLYFDQIGQLFISDMFHNRVRRVTATVIDYPFATMRVGKVSAPQAEGLEDDGNATLNITGFTFNQAQFDAATTTCAIGALQTGSTCNMGVDFAPTVVGSTVSGSVTINSDAGNSPDVINLSGQVLSVNPTSVALISDINPSMLGATVTFTATVSSSDETIQGTVTFLDGSTPICSTVALSGKVATCATSALTLGSHSITASYTGDDDNAASVSTALTQIVKQAAVATLTATPNPVVVTNAVTLSTAVVAPTGTATGSVTFYDGPNALQTVTLNQLAVATMTTASLSSGAHSLTAKYSGDATNAAATSNTVTLTVNLASTTATLNTSATSAQVGTAVTFTAGLTSSGGPVPTGSVEFLDNTQLLATQSLAVGASSSVATLTTVALTPGSHSITAKYLGDTDNDVSTSAAVLVTVNQLTTATTLTADVNPANAGAAVTFTAQVSSTQSNANAGGISGSVLFKDAGVTIGTGVLDSNGRATFQTSTLSVASHAITATYEGNTNYDTSTSSAVSEVIRQTNSTTVLAVSGTGLAGKALSLTASVTSATGIPTGTVNFMDGSTVVGTGTLDAKGSATASTSTLTVGTHSLTAVYAGSSSYSTSTSEAFSQVIVLATPSLTLGGPTGSVNVGTSAVFTATIASPGLTPTGTLTLLDGSTVVSSQTVASTNTFSLTSLGVGTHLMSVKYAGDSYNAAASSNTVTVVVQQGSTTTALAVDKAVQTLGQPVALTAEVSSPSPGISGSVTFYDGTNSLGSVAVASNGAALLSTSSLPFGSHSITAVYSGDSNHSASTSSAVSVRIVQPVTFVLSSSAATAVTGTAVTFTAHLSGAASIAPSGTVNFLDGGVLIATGTLDGSGTATYTTSSLSVASHTITASYAGDTNYAAANSNAVLETITNASTQVAIAASASPVTYGAALILTSTVTTNGGIATGNITFTEGSTLIGTALLNSAGVATLTTSTLAPGTHLLVANYAGDGKASAGVSTPVSVVVKQATSVGLTTSANPASTLSAITFIATVANAGQDVPGGTVTFLDGTTTLGTASLDGNGQAALTVAKLSAASHSVTAVYSGNGTNFGSSSTPVIEVVSLRPTTTVLTASADPSNSQQATLIAVVRYDGSVAPTGTVTFYNGSTAIGTSSVDSTGVATLVIAIGSQEETLTAAYSGDDSYAASTSDPTTIGAQQSPEFSVTLSPSSLSFPSGQHQAVALSVVSLGTFADTMQYGCVGLPTAATCTFSSSTQTLKAGGTLAVTLTVDTGHPLGSGASAASSGWISAGLLSLLALVGFKRRKRLPALLAVFAAAGLMLGTSGCAGLQVNSTPVGNYTFQVVARGQNTGIAESATMTLNVTK